MFLYVLALYAGFLIPIPSPHRSLDTSSASMDKKGRPIADEKVALPVVES
jgi:hypothetical protein